MGVRGHRPRENSLPRSGDRAHLSRDFPSLRAASGRDRGAGGARAGGPRARSGRIDATVASVRDTEYLPVYVLLFAVTLPIYLGTQALVEAIFADPGLGTLFIINLTGLPSTQIGFLMQVFLIAILVLVASLGAEVLAWYLDPRLATRGADEAERMAVNPPRPNPASELTTEESGWAHPRSPPS